MWGGGADSLLFVTYIEDICDLINTWHATLINNTHTEIPFFQYTIYLFVLITCCKLSFWELNAICDKEKLLILNNEKMRRCLSALYHHTDGSPFDSNGESVIISASGSEGENVT